MVKCLILLMEKFDSEIELDACMQCSQLAAFCMRRDLQLESQNIARLIPGFRDTMEGNFTYLPSIY